MRQITASSDTIFFFFFLISSDIGMVKSFVIQLDLMIFSIEMDTQVQIPHSLLL